jgi:mevalonate kinase
MNFSTRANGKLLLTGEYFVTEGAAALALPTRLGQTLEVSTLDHETGILRWQSLDNQQVIWFEADFNLTNFDIQTVSEGEGSQQIAEVLQTVLRAARRQNADFLANNEAVLAQTVLEFPRSWGLGSSSTLVSVIADWAKVDAFQLLSNTMGGSGYDIAAAKSDKAIIFQKFNGQNRWESIDFNPVFHQKLYFVYLNKKQDSRLAMVYYSTTPPEVRHEPLRRISQITHNIHALARPQAVSNVKSSGNVQISIAQVADNQDFAQLMLEHEQLVAQVIKQPRAKDMYFADFNGEIKSLGAWGGDFVLAYSNQNEADTKAYFHQKGFETVLTYKEMIK